FPPSIAIHGEIPADQCREDRAAATDRRHVTLELRNHLCGAGRRRVAAIEEAMNRDAWHVMRNEGPDGGEQMLIDGMHATRAEQSHDVEGATGGAHVAGQGSEGWERGELAPADTLLDAHE